MAILGHIDVLSGQSVSGKSTAEAQQTIDSNTTLAETEAQAIEERVEHSLSSLHGEGLLTVPSVSYGAGSLQVTFGAFTGLLGAYISFAGGTATCLANQTDASLWFQQDSTFATSTPAAKTNFVIGTYSSNGTGITAFTLAGKLVIPILYTLTGTVANIYVPDDVDYATGYVDHSATVLFAIDGTLKLTVSDADAFTVEELYPGGLIDKTSDFAHDPPRQRTDGGFHYKITRGAAYPYASDPTVTLSYTRVGFRLAT